MGIPKTLPNGCSTDAHSSRQIDFVHSLEDCFKYCDENTNKCGAVSWNGACWVDERLKEGFICCNNGASFNGAYVVGAAGCPYDNPGCMGSNAFEAGHNTTVTV